MKLDSVYEYMGQKLDHTIGAMGILINPPWHTDDFKIETLIEKLKISE